jgi:hypothetical protein
LPLPSRWNKPKSWERHGLKSWIEAAKKRLHRNVLAGEALPPPLDTAPLIRAPELRNRLDLPWEHQALPDTSEYCFRPTAWEHEVLEDFPAFTPMPIGSATIFAFGALVPS